MSVYMITIIWFLVNVSFFFPFKMWFDFVERTCVLVVGAVVIEAFVVAELADVPVWVISVGVQVTI